MGNAGIHSIKSVEQNLNLKRSNRRNMFHLKEKLSSQYKTYFPSYISPEEKKHMNKIAKKAKIREWSIQLSLHIFILLGLYWWWFH